MSIWHRQKSGKMPILPLAFSFLISASFEQYWMWVCVLWWADDLSQICLCFLPSNWWDRLQHPMTLIRSMYVVVNWMDEWMDAWIDGWMTSDLHISPLFAVKPSMRHPSGVPSSLSIRLINHGSTGQPLSSPSTHVLQHQGSCHTTLKINYPN